MKSKRNNESHPWKKAFSAKQAKIERERRKEIEKIEKKMILNNTCNVKIRILDDSDEVIEKALKYVGKI